MSLVSLFQLDRWTGFQDAVSSCFVPTDRAHSVRGQGVITGLHLVPYLFPTFLVWVSPTARGLTTLPGRIEFTYVTDWSSHLQLLSTPPHGDAVTLGFRNEARSVRGFSPLLIVCAFRRTSEVGPTSNCRPIATVEHKLTLKREAPALRPAP